MPWSCTMFTYFSVQVFFLMYSSFAVHMLVHIVYINIYIYIIYSSRCTEYLIYSVKQHRQLMYVGPLWASILCENIPCVRWAMRRSGDQNSPFFAFCYPWSGLMKTISSLLSVTLSLWFRDKIRCGSLIFPVQAVVGSHYDNSEYIYHRKTFNISIPIECFF